MRINTKETGARAYVQTLYKTFTNVFRTLIQRCTHVNILCTNVVQTLFKRCTYVVPTLYKRCTYVVATLYIRCKYVVHTRAPVSFVLIRIRQKFRKITDYIVSACVFFFEFGTCDPYESSLGFLRLITLMHVIPLIAHSHPCFLTDIALHPLHPQPAHTTPSDCCE